MSDLPDMTYADFSDGDWMQQALLLAEAGLYSTHPNPRVGCLLVKDNRLIGSGFHQKAGLPHAEINAIKDAQQRFESTNGATAYVTLEPCSHWGKTPPCANALIEAEISRVVIAIKDPNPLVSGCGIQILQDAGIEVTLGVCEKEAARLNRGFFLRMQKNRPWIRTKIAATLDGKTALHNGISQWITSAKARQDNQHYRASASAILTGIQTVLADDPQLTVRNIDIERQPLRIVVDTHYRFPVNARMIDGHPILVATCKKETNKALKLAQQQVETLVLPESNGHVCLQSLMVELARRQINEIHVEAGSKLNGALVNAQLIDEALLYLAPKFMGDRARGMFDLPEMTQLDLMTKLSISHLSQLGDDIKILGRIIYPSCKKKTAF